jgi:hypothetical protein
LVNPLALHDEQECWDAVSKKRRRNERRLIKDASRFVGGVLTLIAAATLAHVPTETMWLVARYVGAIWLVIFCFWFVAGFPLLIACAIFDDRAQKARKAEGAEKTAARLSLAFAPSRQGPQLCHWRRPPSCNGDRGSPH